MGATNASHASRVTSSINPDSDPHLFESLCSLTTFITNSYCVLYIAKRLSPDEVSILASLLASGASISSLTLQFALPPGTAVKLGEAIKATTGSIRALTLGDYHSSLISEDVERALVALASPALEELSIHGDIILVGKCISGSFEKLTALNKLEIVEPNFIKDLVMQLPAGIGKLQALESLTIWNFNLRDDDAEVLAVMKNLPLVNYLSIGSTEIGTKTAQSIGNLVALGRIRELDLCEDKLQDSGVAALVDAILSSSRRRCELHVLDLSGNEIGPDGGHKVASLVSHSPHLRTLDLSRNSIGETAAVALGSAIKLSAAAKSLEMLTVVYCSLGSRGAASIMDSLHCCSALSTVMINGSKGENVDIRVVVKFLLSPGRRTTLTTLWIPPIKIEEAGVLELAAAFSGACYALRMMIMSPSFLGPHCAAVIIDAITNASTWPMYMLDFSCCGIGDDGASAVGRLIKRRGCEIMSLGGNEIHTAGAKSIADSVATSARTMECLCLDKNPIGDEGVRYLLDKILKQKSRLVRKLNISDIDMGVKGAMAVKLVVKAEGLIDQLIVSWQYGDKKAYQILSDVMEWERDSKPPGTAILVPE